MSLGTFTLADNAPDRTPRSISGQPLIDAIEADTDGRLTLIVVRNTINANGQYFESRESGIVGTTTPRLDATVIPEPASAALLALGGLTLLRRKRRGQ